MEFEEWVEKNLEIEEMARAGMHFGQKASKVHPKMYPFIFGMRNTIHIIDLEKTKEKLKEALKFIFEFSREGKILLFVGTKPQLRDLVKEIATETGFPYVNQRWIGGLITNFQEIKKRILFLKELEEKKESEDFKKYTKKERKEIEDEIQLLEKKFGGLKTLEKLPDGIFICDLTKDHLAAKEAKMKKIKVVAICNTDANPSLANYPIPANDDAISSVKFILDKVKTAILMARGFQNDGTN